MAVAGRRGSVLALLVLALPFEASARTAHRAGVFDFYVLALSWSPTYCLTAGDGADRRQCAARSEGGAGHGFIVHGLWPQFESGYPEHCATRLPGRVPTELGRGLLDIVPSMGLIGHMWRKHGTCSGLSQADYLEAVRAAFDSIAIPDALDGIDDPARLPSGAIEDAFIAANPGMTRAGIATRCASGRLQEVRICLTDTFAFRACREVDAAGCRAGSLAVPQPR
jgi:ribonuclease T2